MHLAVAYIATHRTKEQSLCDAIVERSITITFYLLIIKL